MIRFRDFEALGLRVAALSDKTDGDCAARAPSPAPRQQFLAACGVAPRSLSSISLVHGDRVISVDEADCAEARVTQGEKAPEADAMITRTPGLALALTVADCVPVYLFAPDNGAAALIHAGRAGIEQQIVPKTITALSQHYAVAPDSIHALIGPSAGPCCYEVDTATADRFLAAGGSARGRYLDLWATLQAQILEAGLAPDRVAVTGYCTICGDRYYSFRSQDIHARNLAVLMI